MMIMVVNGRRDIQKIIGEEITTNENITLDETIIIIKIEKIIIKKTIVIILFFTFL